MSARAWLRGFVLLAAPIAAAAAQDSTLAIRGIVMDSVGKKPLVGARVIASRAVSADSLNSPHEFTAKTDSSGRFEIRPLAPAVFLVTVEHPWIDSTGFDVPPRTIDLRNHRSAMLNLAVPSGPTIRTAFCPPGVRDSAHGLVEGYVRDAVSDEAVIGVRVLFAWSDFTVNKRTGRATPHHHAFATSTARDGSFVVCGLPVAETILMQAQIEERAATGAVEVAIPSGGVLVETLRIATNKAGTVSVSGSVRRGGTELPVVGAHVHVFGADDEVVTADDGSFHLNDVPIGTQSIEVTALGLRPRRYAIDVRPSGTGRLSIAMGEGAQSLDTVRTIGQRTHAASLRDEFDARAEHGLGQYITEDMIAKTHPWQTTDLIRYVAGFKVRRDTVFTSRGDFEIGARSTCKPTLLIDGSPADSMNEVMPIAIHGIEIYASSVNVPLKYSSTATASVCGTILIWTK
jgi:Carboxypeptidase regulatory-like domain